MPMRSSKQSSKNNTDINHLAFSVVRNATQPKEKNRAAVELGRLGGLKGGKARAASLSANRRKEIARHAAETRWNKRIK